MQARILLVEPDTAAGRALDRALRREGYVVIRVSDGAQAGAHLEKETFQLMVLDISDPECADIRLLQRRRIFAPDMPVLVLIDFGDDDLGAYAAGADAVQQKPLDPMVLCTWVRARLGHDDRAMIGAKTSRTGVIRNRNNEPSDVARSDTAPSDRIEVGSLVIDLDRQRVTCNGQPLKLSPLEFGLLAALAEKRGRILSREEALEHVWRYKKQVTTRTVDSHIHSIRRKIKAAGGDPDIIVAVHKRGYNVDM